MDIQSFDTGVLIVTLVHLERQLLPRVEEIKQKLGDGETLNDSDLVCLSEALHQTQKLTPCLERHPEYEPLVAKVIHYYKTITDEAIKNEP